MRDNAYNLAWPQSFTLHDFLETVQASLGLETGGFETHNNEKGPAFWQYPTIRRGPLNVTKVCDCFLFSGGARFYETGGRWRQPKRRECQPIIW